MVASHNGLFICPRNVSASSHTVAYGRTSTHYVRLIQTLGFHCLAQVAEERQCLVRDWFGLNDLHLKLNLALQRSHISPHSTPKMINANVPLNANFHAKLDMGHTRV